MTTKKTTTARKATPPAHVSIDRGDGTTAITPVALSDTPAIVDRLLDATDDPSVVRTTTGPHGWVVPTAVAKKAGMGA